MGREERKREEARRRRRQKKRKQQRRVRIMLGATIVVILAVLVLGISRFAAKEEKGKATAAAFEMTKYIEERPKLIVDLLSVNEYSRPGMALEKVNGLVVHYTANPGTTAKQNRDYFEGLSQSGETYASSHFVIGLSGEIVQCIPCSEIAYASNDRNADTIAIECCISDDTGKFNDATYQSLVHLVAWLMGRYDLSIEDVIRHYDVTGKNCPKFYVENQWAWDEFRAEVVTYIDTCGIAKTEGIQ